MAQICCFIPDHILDSIIKKGVAPENVLTACQSTIDSTKRLRDSRTQFGQNIAVNQPQQSNQGIIPNYIHQNLARHAATAELREASLRTAELSTEIRAAKPKPKPKADPQVKRTIYDAQHSLKFNRLPIDKILIKEGGTLLTDAQDPSHDANEAYAGFQKTFDFYWNFFARNSIDDDGLELDGFVHAGVGYRNAFWDGEKMVFGDGDGIVFNGFTDELDVIGHELTHGVVQYTCPLDYKFQSGALNESLADVFGIMVKQWGENPKKPQTVDEANWLIGEGIWAKGIKGRALRDMKNPGTAFDDEQVGKDDQPGHWKDFQKLTLAQDRGGVHINSGIPNHAFYLAATKIGGYAWEGAGPIWYKAMKSGKLSESATFKEFADLTIAAAGKHVDEVTSAWKEVGYPFPEKGAAGDDEDERDEL
jgi:Zn-dependent metalloprotease